MCSSNSYILNKTYFQVKLIAVLLKELFCKRDLQYMTLPASESTYMKLSNLVVEFGFAIE